jgi:hypothetical protein
MRLLPLLLMISAFTSAAPAFADVTLRYAPEEPSTLGLVIEADDQGHIRAVGSGGVDLIFRDDDVFMVQRTQNGPAVARFEDVIALATEARATSGVEQIFTPRTLHVEFQPHGTQRIGDREGELFQVMQVSAATDGPPGEFVLSRDPELQRWAATVSKVLDVQERMIGAVIGIDLDEESRRAGNAIYATGLMLRISRLYRLNAVDTAPIAPERFTLPGPILTRDQLRALHAD